VYAIECDAFAGFAFFGGGMKILDRRILIQIEELAELSRMR